MTPSLPETPVRPVPGVVHRPASLAEAVSLVAAGAAPLAGGTWVMRDPARHSGGHVVLADLAELRGITGGGHVPLVIGSLTTHTELARHDLPPALRALRLAAAGSAFPQIRNVATVGGNIGAVGFPEADLVPALLALDARVRRAGPAGIETVPLAAHLAERPAATIVIDVEVDAAPGQVSGFARQTVRGGGEYALASVAVALTRDGAGTVTDARVVVGAVEAVARRCPGAEAVLRGGPLGAETARAAGTTAAAELSPRDALDAPGWYRTAVLPALFEHAVTRATGEEIR